MLGSLQFVYKRIHTSNTFLLSHCVLKHFKSPARYWYLYEKLFTGVHCCPAMINSNDPRFAEYLHNMSVFTVFSEVVIS